MLTKTDKFVMGLIEFTAAFLAYSTVFFNFPVCYKMLFIFIGIITFSATSYLKGLFETD